MRRPHRILPPTVLALLVAGLTAGCGTGSGDSPAGGGATPDARPLVVTDMYPTTFAVQQVAGDAVRVVQLAPAGVEPHEYELTPKQVALIADADLVAYIPDMIPAVADAIAQDAKGAAVDVTRGIDKLAAVADEHADEPADAHADEAGDAHDGDPHVWLDAANMTTMGRNVAAALTELDIPADASDLATEMTALEADLGAQLATCEVDTMVVNHEAFGYLAAAHGLHQVGISGLSPEAQPSPAKLAEITRLVTQEKISTIYFESLASPTAADTIAAETGAKTALLDPLEGDTDGKGYVAIMRANAATLKAGQRCA